MDLDRDTILAEEKLSANLNTVDDVLKLLGELVLKLQKGEEVFDDEIINGGNQIDTARRIVREVRETLNLSHIVD